MARLAAQMSQRDLARLIHVAPNTVGYYETERNQIRLAVIEKIAEVTGVSPCWLAFGIGQGPAPPAEDGGED